MRFLDRSRGSSPTPDGILEKELLVPTLDIGQEPRVEVLEEDREIPFVLVLDEDGRPVLPAFTSEEALARWRPQRTAYVALQGKVLVEMLAESDWDRMVVDDADGDAFAITRSAAQRLIGVVAYSVSASASFRIGQPANAPPDRLVRDLRIACENEPAITEAYLYQFQIVERDASPHLAVGLLLQPAIGEEEFRRIAKAISDEVGFQEWGYEFLEFHPLEGQLLASARSSGSEILRRA